MLKEHQYSINAIIFDVMGTFKLNAIIRKAGFVKQDGYGVAEILALMIMLPLLLLNSVHSLYRGEFQKIPVHFYLAIHTHASGGATGDFRVH